MLVCLWVTGLTFTSVILRYCPLGACGALRNRWYWLYFFVQILFLIRELLLISFFQRWNVILAAAHVAMAIVTVITVWELWLISYLRKYSPASIDQIMDMVGGGL